VGSVWAAVSLVVARLRAERLGTLLLFLLILLTAFVFSAGPMLLNRVADEGLRHAMASAAASERSLEFTRLGRIQPGPADALEPVTAEGADLEAEFPGVLRDLIESREHVVESIPYLAIQSPRSLTHVELRFQSGIEEHVTLLEGRMPTGATTIVQVPNEISPDGVGGPAIVYEVAVSRATADELRAELGERILMTPDRTVSLPGAGGWAGTFAGIDIVGIFEVDDPQQTYWLSDWSLYLPTLVRVTLDIFEVHATALIAPDAYRVFYEGPPDAVEGEAGQGLGLFPFRYHWRYFLDLGRLNAGVIDELSRQLTRLEANYPFRSQILESDVPSVQTSVARIIENYRLQRVTTEAALAVAAVGPAGAAAGALALVALLQARRRAGSILLVHGRGASGLQVMLAQLIEGLVLAVPAAVLGYGLASVAVGARQSSLAVAADVAVVAVSILILLLVAVPLARSPGSVARPDPQARIQSRARRLVFDGLLIAIAVIGVVLLRSRGVLGGGPVDPYLAAVPALVGLAVGVAALRLYPIPIRALSWLAARGRGLAPSLALRTAARDASVAQLPLLVLILATAMGVFASAVLVTIEEGQTASSYQRVGADYRVDAGLADIIPAELSVAGRPGLDGEARAFVQEGLLRGGQVRRGTATLHAIDVPAYVAVAGGTPADPRFPASFQGSDWPAGEMGGDESPLPAIVTADVAAGARLGVGDTFELAIPGGRAMYRIVEVRQRFPGMDHRPNLVVTPYAALQAAFPTRPLSPTTLFVSGADDGEASLREAITPYERRLSVLSRPQVLAGLHDVPLSAAVTDGLALALLVTLAYSALALACGLILALAARRRDMALLRTMGLRARQVMALTLLEHGPVLLVALAVGVALGIGLSVLVQPGLQLEVFTGPGVDVSLRIDPLHVLALGVIPLLIVGTAVLAGAWLVQRGELGGMVRGSAVQASERTADE
jgi:putative ABC transport system permease protein